jgi:ABC-2 type transport system ATP-binding protein
LDLKHSLPPPFELDGFDYHQIDNTTLEIEIHRGESLNAVFEQLSQKGIEVTSMKNKVNRLEELFLKLVEKSE